MTLHAKLAEIQKNLNAPKGQYNSFGKYAYRSCEDILGAVKGLLDGLVLTVTDEMVLVGNRTYVKAIATITDGKDSIQTTAYAREAEEKKGMDEAQVTGSASSYARKYALNGLLLIDDVKDADTRDNRDSAKKTEKKVTTPTDGALQSLSQDDQAKAGEIAAIMITAWANDNEWGAFEAYDLITDPELRVAVWEILKPHSAMRRRLKEMKTEADKVVTQ